MYVYILESTLDGSQYVGMNQWKTYSDPYGRFTVEYPSYWHVIPIDTKNLRFVPWQEQEFPGFQIAIHEKDLPSSDPDNYRSLKEARRAFTYHVSSLLRKRDVFDMSVNGKQAFLVRDIANPDTIGLAHSISEQVVIDGEQNVFQLSNLSLSQTANDPSFARFYGSFK